MGDVCFGCLILFVVVICFVGCGLWFGCGCLFVVVICVFGGFLYFYMLMVITRVGWVGWLL